MYNSKPIMPIVIKTQKGDSTRDLIRQFKKATAATDIVNKVKDRRFYVKPAQQMNILKSQKRRLKNKIRSLKKMKNISPRVIAYLTERLSENKEKPEKKQRS
jgi:ribosomal protein S21